MKKVMIALDYDPTARKIAETGLSLAKTLGAEVTLLHVIAEANYYSSLEYSPIVGFTGFMDMNPVQLESSDGLIKASQSYLDMLKNHFNDETIQTAVREGDFADSILKAAKELHADIIVMGSHSRKWLENIVMGSVTQKVLNNTSIPLFIIPTKKPN
jgi:nucleotide-binding universal stress UspA family protein